MATSIEKQIFANLKTVLSTGLSSWVKTVEYEVIRNAFTDFKPTEIPAIQIFDRPGALIKHNKSLIDVGWPISIELVLKTTRAGTVNQGELFDKKKDIQDVIAANQKLVVAGVGIEGFQHLRYDTFETDLHTTPDYFAVVLDYTALFTDKYPGCG